jgi:hypothetical protein
MKSPFRSLLIHRPVRHRVREGHAQFHDIHPPSVHGLDDLKREVQGGIPGANVGDEGGLSLFAEFAESGVDSIHGRDCHPSVLLGANQVETVASGTKRVTDSAYGIGIENLHRSNGRGPGGLDHGM